MILAQVTTDAATQGGAAGAVVALTMLAKWLLHDTKQSKRENESDTEQVRLLTRIKDTNEQIVQKLDLQKAVSEIEKQNAKDTALRDQQDLLRAVGSMCRATHK